MSLFDWRARGDKKGRKRTGRSERKSPPVRGHRLFLEALEQRRVLSVTVSPITGPDANSAFDVPSGKNLYVPLNGTDVGQTISYSATSSNPAVTATVLSGNPMLELDVSGTTAGGQAFSGAMTFELFEKHRATNGSGYHQPGECGTVQRRVVLSHGDGLHFRVDPRRHRKNERKIGYHSSPRRVQRGGQLQ